MNITSELPFLNIHNPFTSKRISVYSDKHSRMPMDTKDYFVKRISRLSKGMVILPSVWYQFMRLCRLSRQMHVSSIVTRLFVHVCLHHCSFLVAILGNSQYIICLTLPCKARKGQFMASHTFRMNILNFIVPCVYILN